MPNEQQDGGVDRFKARCFYAQCDKTFDSVNDMVPVAGKGDRTPRHFCEECAERIRRGPPLTDGGVDEHDEEINRCTECGEMIDGEYIPTEGRAHVECAEELFRNRVFPT